VQSAKCRISITGLSFFMQIKRNEKGKYPTGLYTKQLSLSNAYGASFGNWTQDPAEQCIHHSVLKGWRFNEGFHFQCPDLEALPSSRAYLFIYIKLSLCMSYRHKGKWRYSSTTWYEMEANGHFHDLAVLPHPRIRDPGNTPWTAQWAPVPEVYIP